MRIWLVLLVACGGSKKQPEPIEHTTNDSPPAEETATNLDEYVDPSSASPKRSLLLGPDPASAQQKQQLDKQMIRKVLKQNLPKIFFCYESTGEYAAIMRADFTIDANGLVQSAVVTGSDSLALVGCMSRVFLNMQFPKPAGGRSVQVSYPLEIRVAGQ